MKSNAPMPAAVQTQNFTIVMRTERAGDTVMYVGRCVEFDICVQGANVAQVKDRFLKTLWGHAIIAMECGLKPFECLAPGNISPVIALAATERFPANMPRSLVREDLHDRWQAMPRGEATLQFA